MPWSASTCSHGATLSPASRFRRKQETAMPIPPQESPCSACCAASPSKALGRGRGMLTTQKSAARMNSPSVCSLCWKKRKRRDWSCKCERCRKKLKSQRTRGKRRLATLKRKSSASAQPLPPPPALPRHLMPRCRRQLIIPVRSSAL